MVKHKKILFLALKVFASTGGIEKMNCIAAKAMYDTGWDVKLFSSYDKNSIQNRYFPENRFVAFNQKKIQFAFRSIQEGIKNDIVLLSHINLLILGYCIKLLSPKTKLVLFAHGVEIWKPLSYLKKKMIAQCDQIFSVSNFTNDKIRQLGYFGKSQPIVLNNCLDPFLEKGNNNIKSNELLLKYGLTNKDFILLTLTRLNSEEKYKGYDKVLKCLPKLLIEHPGLRYLIIGKYDVEEKLRMDKLIDSLKLNRVVIFTGYIPDKKLSEHYQLADLYIMPSFGEGFGIVFIEAMYYNLPVIAGNKDGSVDALMNGQLGLLVNPDKEEEIATAIRKIVNNKSEFKPNNELLMKNFSYSVYEAKINSALKRLIN